MQLSIKYCGEMRYMMNTYIIEKKNLTIERSLADCSACFLFCAKSVIAALTNLCYKWMSYSCLCLSHMLSPVSSFFISLPIFRCTFTHWQTHKHIFHIVTTHPFSLSCRLAPWCVLLECVHIPMCISLYSAEGWPTMGLSP